MDWCIAEIGWHQMSLQGQLFNNAGDWVGDMYEKTASPRVYLARNAIQPETGKRQFWHKGHSIKSAIVEANNWQSFEEDDCYATMNGFAWDKETGRTVSSVTQLTCFYVDFDYYKIPEYSHLSAIDFASLVLKENSWLPQPTTVTDSGSGLWMYWQFKRPPKLNSKTNYKWMPAWQGAQSFLVDSLKPFGADSACRDAARVVRMPETINSKTGRTTHSWRTGDRYEFNDLTNVIRDQKKVVAAKSAEQRKFKSKKKSNTVHSAMGHIRTPYTLHWGRMKDYEKLADLRGGLLYEHRRTILWFYAVSAAWYCNDEESLRSEVEQFCKSYLGNPDDYVTFNYQSTVDRFKQHCELKSQGYTLDEIWEMLDQGSKDLYKLTSKRIITDLEITSAEQRKMKVTIGPEEYKRRDALRSANNRRKRGCKTRDEYNDQRKRSTAENVSEALRLRASGLSVRQIGLTMGRGVGTVHRWLSEG
jgi:hypothetical protein